MKNLRSVLAIAAVLAAATATVHAHNQQQQLRGQAIGQTSSKVSDWTRIAETAEERAESLRDAQKTAARCIDGMAADTYPCDGIDMLSFVDIGTLGFGVTFVNDMWGWTDPMTRREYALLGTDVGTFAIDVTRPKQPNIIGILPTASDQGGFFWRDIKVFDNHAFIVSEHDNHGMQVLDLSLLRSADTSAGPVTFPEAARYNGFSSAHNIAINEDTGYAYVVGADTCLGGLEMIDIGAPSAPVGAGCFSGFGYVHDTQCVNYLGPDADYVGQEICFNATPDFPTANTVSIVDVTDKSNPIGIANVEYGVGTDYSHQGWLTQDQTHYVHGDELDEFFGSVATTTTRIWNVEDLDNPLLIAETTNGTTSIDHNIYIREELSFASNYTSGLRVFDVDDVDEGEYKEIAYFDMYPENDDPTFEGGTWSNYPYFRRNGVVAVSSMDRGLFMLRLSDDDDDDDEDDDEDDDDDDDDDEEDDD